MIAARSTLFQPAADRQQIVDTLHHMLKGAGNLAGFPGQIKNALRDRIWEGERISPNGSKIEPVSLEAFICERYPVGLGTTYGTIESLLVADSMLYRDFVHERGGTPEECCKPETTALAAVQALVDHLPADALATMRQALRSTTVDHIATALAGLAGDAP